MRIKGREEEKERGPINCQKETGASAPNQVIMWKTKLVTLYCTVCQCYDSRLKAVVQRLSNNARPQFTDEEVITVFLWGILTGHFELKAIYKSTKMYLDEWFPRLPSYQAFCRRLGDLEPAFEILSSIWMDVLAGQDTLSASYAMDSCPIILAKQSRCSKAKVLGHADVQTTMKIYTHLSEQKEQNSINALNSFISEREGVISGFNKK